MTRYRDLLFGLGALTAAAVSLYLLGTNGYPGGPDECIALGDCYCEAIGPGRVAQPANAWSNAAFVVAGLAVLADTGRRGPSRSSSAWGRLPSTAR